MLATTLLGRPRPAQIRPSSRANPTPSGAAAREFVERDACDLLVLGCVGPAASYNRLSGGATSRLVERATRAIVK